MKNSKQFISIVTTAMTYCKWAIAILVVIICLSGVRVVNNHEVALILRFGELVGDTREEQIHDPGLLLAFPYVIDEVIKVEVGKVHEIAIKTHFSDTDPAYADIQSTGYIITGDENLLHLDATVKYKITDPVEYALYNVDPQTTINGVVSGVLSTSAVSKGVDGLLTNEKEAYTNEVIMQSQAILDALQLGVSISSIEFKSIVPPDALSYHFDQVNAAYVEKETKIQEANQYREKVIPDAMANADQLVQMATMDQLARMNEANDLIAEFNGLYAEYRANRDVVYQRIFREKVTTIFNQMGGKIVIPQGGSTPQIFLP